MGADIPKGGMADDAALRCPIGGRGKRGALGAEAHPGEAGPRSEQWTPARGAFTIRWSRRLGRTLRTRRLAAAVRALRGHADPGIATEWRRRVNREICRGLHAELAKTMAVWCVRNTRLENHHAGRVPVTRMRDYSDVTVVDADGRRIPCPEVSHFDNDAMRDLMRQVVVRLYTFHELPDNPGLLRLMERWSTVTRRWDETKLDRVPLAVVDEASKLAEMDGERDGRNAED